jgi:non-ribosomal peptide synthetase component F
MLVDDPESSRKPDLTYAELRRRALRFADQLREMGIKRGDRVVICLPRGLDQYMAILGTLWVGACYVPVDWTYPQDRIDYIAQDSGAVLVVTESERSAAMPVRVLELDTMLGDLAAHEAVEITRADTGASPEDLAYIIYTSGTTGRPKGVMISHRNACHLVRSECAILALDHTDRVFGGFSLAFDMSVETMWSAFFVGAELLVADEALAKAGPDMAGVLAAEGLTVWHVVPSLLSGRDADAHLAPAQSGRRGLPARAGGPLGAPRPAHAQHLWPHRNHGDRDLDRGAAGPPRHHRQAAARLHRVDRGREAVAGACGRRGRAGDRRAGRGSGLCRAA